VLLAVLKNVLFGPLITNVFRPVTEGAQHVPDNGAAIIASIICPLRTGCSCRLRWIAEQPLSPT
jgi:hypothetical protein